MGTIYESNGIHVYREGVKSPVDVRITDQGCLGKNQYHTKSGADSANRMVFKNPKATSYLCHTCHKWHLTTK